MNLSSRPLKVRESSVSAGSTSAMLIERESDRLSGASDPLFRVLASDFALTALS